MNSLQSSYAGYQLFNGDLNVLPLLSKVVVNTINQYSFCVAEHDKNFKKALMDSDILLPDGVGIVVAVKTVTGLGIKKISGSDLHLQQLTRLNNSNGRCFYLGSSTKTLGKIRERINREFPNITCESYSPPFKANFSDSENAEMIEKINAFKPDVVFVGMTAPKQEKWVNQQKGNIDAQLICSIGAVFDFFAGTVERPSKFWIDMGLEWFVRLCKEPKRMWKRYLYYGPIFVYMLLKEKLKADLASDGFINHLQEIKTPVTPI